jgi:hypothetical protein
MVHVTTSKNSGNDWADQGLDDRHSVTRVEDALVRHQVIDAIYRAIESGITKNYFQEWLCCMLVMIVSSTRSQDVPVPDDADSLVLTHTPILKDLVDPALLSAWSRYSRSSEERG